MTAFVDGDRHHRTNVLTLVAWWLICRRELGKKVQDANIGQTLQEKLSTVGAKVACSLDHCSLAVFDRGDSPCVVYDHSCQIPPLVPKCRTKQARYFIPQLLVPPVCSQFQFHLVPVPSLEMR